MYSQSNRKNIEETLKNDKDANTLIVIKRFSSVSQAHIYAARLNDAHIASVINNTNMASVLPMFELLITLKVRKKDYKAALQIIEEMEQRDAADNPSTDRCFKDADLNEILYEKKMYELRTQNVADSNTFFVILFFILLVIIWGIFLS